MVQSDTDLFFAAVRDNRDASKHINNIDISKTILTAYHKRQSRALFYLLQNHKQDMSFIINKIFILSCHQNNLLIAKDILDLAGEMIPRGEQYYTALDNSLDRGYKDITNLLQLHA